MRFTYTAEKNGGEVYKGVAEAQDRFELYAIVRREGAHILSVNEDSSQSIMSMRYWNAKIARVKEYEKILFARNLGAMLSAGLSLARALSVIERQTKNIKLQDVVSTVASDVRRGDPLHTALEKTPTVFSKLFVAMVRAGEEGGDLPTALQVIADQTERMYDLKRKIRGAMIYPAIIVFAIIAIGILMMIYVVPTLAQTFAELNAKLPFTTQLVITISRILSQYTVLALLAMAAVGGAFYAALRTKRGKRTSDYVFLRVPVIGVLVREINAARTARTLSSLLASGVDVLTSISIAREVVQNTYFQDVLDEASKSVGSGEPLSAVFARNEKLYPPFVGEMAAVGEETGTTTEMFKRLAVYYEDEVDRKTKDMSTIVEPFLMMIIGVAVGFFAVSMIAPIYQMSQNIN